MKISTNNLGCREVYRLIQFVDVIIDRHFKDCSESTFGYDSYTDEPYLETEEGLTLYASDYDIAYTSDNKICNL